MPGQLMERGYDLRFQHPSVRWVYAAGVQRGACHLGYTPICFPAVFPCYIDAVYASDDRVLIRECARTGNELCFAWGGDPTYALEPATGKRTSGRFDEDEWFTHLETAPEEGGDGEFRIEVSPPNGDVMLVRRCGSEAKTTRLLSSSWTYEFRAPTYDWAEYRPFRVGDILIVPLYQHVVCVDISRVPCD